MRKPLTSAQMRALRLIDGGATRLSDVKRERVSRATINQLSDAGLIDTGRFPGAVYTTAEGHAALRATPTTEDKGREDRA